MTEFDGDRLKITLDNFCGVEDVYISRGFIAYARSGSLPQDYTCYRRLTGGDSDKYDTGVGKTAEGGRNSRENMAFVA